MKKQKTIYCYMIVLFSVLFMAANLSAASSMSNIQQNMKKRLPEVVTLKKNGIIGENNKGLLEFITNNRQKANLVNAENNDRKTVYRAIAKQQKTTESFVAEQRAKQIRDKGEKGFYYQKPNGTWYKK